MPLVFGDDEDDDDAVWPLSGGDAASPAFDSLARGGDAEEESFDSFDEGSVLMTPTTIAGDAEGSSFSVLMAPGNADAVGPRGDADASLLFEAAAAAAAAATASAELASLSLQNIRKKEPPSIIAQHKQRTDGGKWSVSSVIIQEKKVCYAKDEWGRRLKTRPYAF